MRLISIALHTSGFLLLLQHDLCDLHFAHPSSKTGFFMEFFCVLPGLLLPVGLGLSIPKAGVF